MGRRQWTDNLPLTHGISIPFTLCCLILFHSVLVPFCIGFILLVLIPFHSIVNIQFLLPWHDFTVCSLYLGGGCLCG